LIPPKPWRRSVTEKLIKRSWKEEEEEEEGGLHRSDDGFLTRMIEVLDRRDQPRHHHAPSCISLSLSLAFCHLPRPSLSSAGPSYTAAPPLDFFTDYSFSGLFLLEVGGGDS
jgi:hypothetical protein